MSKRKIVVNGNEYTYVVGRSNVRITRPDGTSYAADFREVTGLSWSVIERGQWKGTRDGMVTPGQVAEVIKSHE